MDKLLSYGHQFRVFQLREVTRAIALTQSREALKVEQISGLARGEPRQAQLVLRMRYLQELSQHEIAEALEIPIGMVKSRINYGLTTLRQTMKRGV